MTRVDQKVRPLPPLQAVFAATNQPRLIFDARRIASGGEYDALIGFANTTPRTLLPFR